MGFLRRLSDGAVTQLLSPDSLEYQTIADLRNVANPAQALFEEIAEEDISTALNRIYALYDPGAATAANETISGPGEPGRPGSITAVNMIATSNVNGVTTNTRTITVVQGSAQGAGSPARTTLATLALVNGVNLVAGQPSPAFTINQAAFIGGAPLEVVSTAGGTGLADPGGVVLVTYTPV